MGLTAFIACTLAALSGTALAQDPAVPPRKIVLIAGPITGHPKDAHEYEKSVILLKHLLDTSPGLKGLRVEAHFRGWPADPRALDDAATIVMVSDGSDQKETDHPLYVGDRLARLEDATRRGSGFVQLHWTTFHPSRFHDRITEIAGGYFDYETGTGNPRWYSRIETRKWQVSVLAPEHPISRGVQPFSLEEEFYYRLRFRENDPRLRPILAIDPASGGTVAERTVAWAIERAGGGRSFGFTGGHFFANWRSADFRRLVLNAIVWSAGAEVPEGGVRSEVEEPIRALILTGYNHPAHEWRSVTAALLGVLEQDPRVAVEVTEETEDLAAPRLLTYGLLVLNYSNWDRPGLSEAAKEGLLKYLAGGGGLAVIHFANGAFNHTLRVKESDWEEYRTRIVRRVWMHGEGGSGHDAFAPFRVEITSLRHPITQGLQPFDTEDELYFNQKGDLPIEPLATAHSKVTGKDEPMAWAYEYGRARVFLTVLGHSDVSVRKAGALIRRGSVWAAGRSQISFDPPPGLTEGLLFRDGSQWSPRKSKEAEGKKTDRRQGNAAPQGDRDSSGGSGRKAAVADERPAQALDARPADVLPPNPGLDGGVGGHWGVKNDADWDDPRIAAMDYGQFLSSSLETPSGTVAKAISIRLGDRGEAGVCFDAGARSLTCGWTGGFLRLSPRRFGLIEMPRIAGSVAFSAPPGPGWASGGGYRGLHVNGRRVVLEYLVDGLRVLESPWVEEARDIRVITRTLEMGASSRPQVLHALRVKAGASLLPESTSSFAALEEKGDVVTAMAITGCPGARIEAAGGARLDVIIPGSAAATRRKLLHWRGSREALPGFRALAAGSPEPEDLAALLRPGPPRWGPPLETRGVLGAGEGPYVIDTLTVPHENPHRALLYLSGHDFFSSGGAAVSTVHGDVWTVSGIDARLEKLAWRRFAAGLYQPLGLRIVNDEVHVLGRDQITRLHDLDGDGEADFYECFSNDSVTSPAGHDFHTCLETDAEGRFYYLSPRGLHRVSRDGRTQETIASGWRNPNGLAVGPDGTITVSPQEGEWTPASQICEVKSGGYYGYPGPRTGADRPLGRDLPLCWIPRHVDNSTGGQVWVTGGRWGPLEGQLLSFSFGRSSMQLVLRDASSGVAQGAVVPMKGRFLSGAMRGRFRPEDGHLYVTGLMGWVTNAVRDGCFQRVRYTGGKVHYPTAFSVHSNGIRLGFAEALDAASAVDAGNWSARQWNYRYAEAYGSEEYSVVHAGQVGHDPVGIASASLLDDGRSVFVEIPSIRPVMQLHLRASLRSRDGADVAFDLYATVHSLGPPVVLEMESDASPGAEAAGELTGAIEEPGGLALTITSSRTGASDTRISRLAALRVPGGSCPGPFLEPGPFHAVWRGHLSLDESGRLELSAAGRGRLKLLVDGRVLLEGAGDDLARIGPGAARLRRGRRAITVEYDAPGQGDAWLRLYWSGQDFARETIPETALSHPPDAPGLARGLHLREGRRLVAELRCLKCHAPVSEAWRGARGMPELGEDAPSLVDIGSRLEESWMAAWIGSPSRLRPSARMPALVEDGSAGARDMAAYLASLRGGKDDATPRADASSSAGGELFARLGCIACHTRPDDSREDPGDGRLALHRVGEKWQAPALRDFLLEPSRRHRSTRMPSFKLTPGEAGALGAFLLAAPRAVVPPDRLPASRGDPGAGKLLVQTLGCLNCHELPLENRFRAPSLEAILRADWSRTGCVAAEPHSGCAPRLRLNDGERLAIRDFAAGGVEPLFREDLAEAANRAVDALRCTACHERGGRQPFWASVAGETGSIASSIPSPITVQSRPALTFTGEQLEAPWLRRFIAGELEYTVRPWLDARMPAFPAHADVLARGLALDHGCSPEEAPETPPSPGVVEAAVIGKQLLGAAQGFSCVSCHPVGREPAQMQLHFGAINLQHSRERLRHEHYLRWMLNPQRIDPLSVMPAYTEEDGRSVLTQLLDGHGPRQFDAIWQYLGTVR